MLTTSEQFWPTLFLWLLTFLNVARKNKRRVKILRCPGFNFTSVKWKTAGYWHQYCLFKKNMLNAGKWNGFKFSWVLHSGHIILYTSRVLCEQSNVQDPTGGRIALVTLLLFRLLIVLNVDLQNLKIEVFLKLFPFPVKRAEKMLLLFRFCNSWSELMLHSLSHLSCSNTGCPSGTDRF